MRKHLLLTCALVASLTSAFGETVKFTHSYLDEENNIKRVYLELNTSNHEATVVSGDWEYTGKIIIPDAVEYPEGSGTMYKVTTIGKGGDATQANSPFYYCYDLDEVVFGANVKTIKKNAFYRCGTESRPVKLNLDSEGLVTIETSAINQVALRANYGDNTILLGKNITQFGPAGATSTDNWNPWGDLINITAFKVADGNTAFSTDANGVLYNSDKTTLISFPKYKNQNTFEIPTTVTTVRSYAFYKMKYLRTVTGGDNVVRLGSVISGLTSLRMGPKLTTMSPSAFMYCGESFVPVIDASNTTFKLIDNVLFKFETDKVTLCWFLRGNQTENYVMPWFVTNIPYGAFYPNKYIKTIDFSQATKLTPDKIDKDAFIGTVNSIEFTGAENFYHNVDGVWYNYDYTRLEIFGSDATVENFVMNDATTTLPRAAVKKNDKVKTIKFNSKLSSFDSQDFYKWENLEKYYVKEGNSKLWADADGVLYNSAKTKVVAYPRGNTRAFYKVIDGTTNIGTYAFYYNKNLMALDLGDDIKSVVESNCNNLAGMQQLKAIKVGTMVPPTVTTSTFTNSQLTGGNIVLYIPKDEGAYEIYKNASIWNRFTIIRDVSKFDEEIRQIPINYSVKHYVQNTDDDDYTLVETNNATGTLLGTSNATAKTDGDYAYLEPQSFEQITLNNNGMAVEIRYHRKPFTITWKNGETTLFTKTYRYGASFLQDKPDDPAAVAGKHFVGWNTDANATGATTFNGSEVVRGNTTYYAIFADNANTSYVVKHYQENADDNGYTLVDTDNDLSAPFGSSTHAEARSYNGFNAPESIAQLPIAQDGSTVIEIRYTRIEYPVTWINGSTTLSKSGYYKYGSTLDVPDDPEAAQGQRFVGWNENSEAQSSELGQTVPLGGVTYYAIFTATGNMDYTIKHYQQDLDEVHYTLVATGTGTGQIDFTTTAQPNSYPGFTHQPITQQTITDAGATVEIRYNRNRYNVVWKNGNDVFQTDKNQLFGSAIHAPATNPAAEPGEHFAGWNSDPDAESPINLDNATVTVDGITYYAKFATNAIVHYTVKHYLENLDGSFPDDPEDNDDETGVFGLDATATVKTYTGFTAQQFTPQTIAEDGSTVVRIEYLRKSHSLSWNENGGELSGNFTTGDVKFGAPITAPTATLLGHSFFGWNTSTEHATATVPETMPDNNLTFYAIWNVNQYHAAFYYNNPAHVNEEFTGWNYDFKATINRPAGNPLPTDYDGHHDFVGWSANKDGNINDIITGDDFGEMTTAGAKFYAIWQVHSNTLAWNANGGALSGDYTEGLVEYGATIDTATATRTGYTFKGWATSENGTPVAAVSATMPDYDLTYYAIWEINSHNLSWNANEGTLSGDYTEGVVEYGATIDTATATRTGYTFKGWAETAEATIADIITPATSMPDRNLTYYAVWEVHKHQLTWYPNGGEFTNSDPSGQVAYGTEITTPQVKRIDPDPEIEWKCAGWGTSEDATVAITPASTMPDEDLAYYAIWILKKNVVTWKRNYSNDDDFNATATHVEVGQDITAPDMIPENPHHHFLGWSATRNGDVITDGNFGKMDTDKKEFYARWEINSHNLSWNANEGALSGGYTEGVVKYGATITPATATRIGYEFQDWALSTNPTVATEISTMPDNDVEYIAIWEAKPYPVTWMKNDGTEEIIDVTSVYFDSEIQPTSKDVAREHYKFIGWAETPEGEVITNFGTLKTEGAIFYAKWETRKYVLGWDGNNGVLSGIYTPAGEVDYGTHIVPPTATRTNYIHAGWGTAVKPDSAVNITTMPDSSVTYVAMWLPNHYIVEWRKNDGTEDNYQATNVDYNNLIVAPEINPERTHYQFLGWSETEDGEVITEFGKMLADHAIYYAQWQINSNTLSWNANGGELSGNYTSGSVEYGTTIVRPVATREGYTYNGWNTYADAVDSVSISTMPDNDIEYFAIWAANSYHVSWMRNDGSDDIFETTDVAFGNSIEKPSDPSREHYQFLGWSTASDGDIVTDYGTMGTEDITFYAQWQINSHTLVWNANGGELSGDYTQGEVEYDSTIIVPTASRIGFTFDGWGATDNTTEAIEITTMPDNDVEYFAIWKVNSYTAKWHFDSDSIFASTTVNFGDTIKAPLSMPERADFNFLGWAATENGSAIDSFGLMPATDTAFFAVWEEIEVVTDKYAVLWKLNDGTASVFKTDSLAEGNTILAPTEKPEREQFTFAGWAATETGSAIDSFGLMPAADTAFFAIWEAVEDTTITPATFTATWYMNNGSDSVFVTSKFAEGDSIVTPAENPVREQFTFTGWAATENGIAIDSFGLMPAADTAFFAVWEAVEDSTLLSVDWLMNDGTDSVYMIQKYALGDSIAAPAINPERIGHQFLGWSADSTGTLITKFDTINADTAFFAIWMKNQYVITWYFDQNDTLKIDTLAYGDAIIAPAENPARVHYIFKGWATAAESDSVIADFGTVTDSASFYAVWEEEVVKQYAAVWYYNDGTNSAFKTTMVNAGATISAPSSTPTRERYEFKGWATTATGNVTNNFGTMTEGGAVFYAVWAAIVNFDAPENFNSCETGDDFIKLTNISHSDIVFEWNINGDIDSIQTDGYFEFSKEMALSGTIEVTGIVGNSRLTKTINYQRNKDMLRTMWDDVITVVNGEGYFKSYKWYHNGALVDTTELHYEAGGLTGTYKLVATTVDDVEITSCEMTFSEPTIASISVYPNPVVTTIRVESSSLTPGARIFVLDNDGKVRMTKDATGNGSEELNVSTLPQGIYIVKIGNQSASIIKL